MPLRGLHLQALCCGPESHWTAHTLCSAADESVTVKVAVVHTDQRTRQRHRRAAWYLFVCLVIRDSLIGVRQRDRKWFGR